MRFNVNIIIRMSTVLLLRAIREIHRREEVKVLAPAAARRPPGEARRSLHENRNIHVNNILPTIIINLRRFQYIITIVNILHACTSCIKLLPKFLLLLPYKDVRSPNILHPRPVTYNDNNNYYTLLTDIIIYDTTG